ncbi:Calx-beta domain-containing protein [Candidatus Palauibacter sp.]|uniref:Calx-beta domain-containing protein n=1 Tax=Candidatus Palauibacter sp. TaxID=3101350 RepID=UPI003B529EEB
MTLDPLARPSSVNIPRGRAATRAIFRIIGVVVPLLALVAPAQATGDAPASGLTADTLSVTLSAPPGGWVTEGDTARFTLAVKGRAGSGHVTVRYAVSGTATSGEDYVALSGELTLSGGARSATIDLAVVSGEIADGGETVILTLTSGTGPTMVVVNTTPATVTIRDPPAAGRQAGGSKGGAASPCRAAVFNTA